MTEGVTDGESDGVMLRLSDGVMLTLSDGVMLRLSDGVMVNESDGVILTLSDGVMLRLSDGVRLRLSDGVRLRLSDGVMVNESDGVMLTLSEADGDGDAVDEGQMSVSAMTETWPAHALLSGQPMRRLYTEKLGASGVMQVGVTSFVSVVAGQPAKTPKATWPPVVS